MVDVDPSRKPDGAERLHGDCPPSTASIDGASVHQQQFATLRLVGGEEIHCGPENALLRNVIHLLLSSESLEENSAFDSNVFPLVLHGEPLCGKSMVAHGLANAWKQRLPKKTICVLTAADLTRALQRTELADDILRFTDQLKHAGLVVLDDVHRLQDKLAAQEWLTNLLDYRNRQNKPIIATSQLPISKTKLKPRLISRLTAGLSIPIALPYAATRKDVILKSAAAFNVSLPLDDVDRLVAVTSGKSVSNIQSVIATVATTGNDNDNTIEDSVIGSDNSSRFKKAPSAVSKKLKARHTNALLDALQATDESISQEELIQKVIRTTGRRFGVKVTDIRGPSRRKNTVLARSTAMFILREVTPLSLVEIGKLFRNRDHSTVLHSCDKIRKEVVANESIRELISSICTSLNITMPPSWFELLDAG